MKDAVANFQRAHTTTYEKNGYFWTERNREWVKASKMVEHLLAENPIQGLLQTKNDEASIKVLNILTQCVFKIEPDFELG